MGWLDRLRGRDSKAANAGPANSITIEQLIERLSAGMTAATGEVVSDSTVESLAAVGAAVGLLSNTVASTETALFRKISDGRKERAVNDPLWDLLTESPNDILTAFQLKAMIQRDIELRGNGYIYPVRGFGDRVVALERLHPDLTKKVKKLNGEIKFEYRSAAGIQEYDLDEVLHLWMWSDDGLNGKSRIQVFRETFGKALAQRKHAAKFFSSGAKASGILNIEANNEMSDESMAALRDDFNKLYSGTDNAYQTIVLPAGINYTPVGVSMEDAQFIESTQLSVTEVAMIFGVPPHKLGNLDRATFNNIEHQAIEFVLDAMKPRFVMWEQGLNKALLPNNSNMMFKFDWKSLLVGDQKSHAEAHNLYRRMGVFNANEIRDELGLNRRTDEGGDDYIVESNMALNDGSNPSGARPTQGQ